MNAYKQIAREHLSLEDLEELLSEKRKEQPKPSPKKMSYAKQRQQYYLDELKKKFS